MYEINLMKDSIGHEIKACGHVMQRRMLSSAVKAGVDRVTIMHGWIINYLFFNREKDVFQKDIESEFSISPSSVTNILKLMEKKGYIKRVSVDSDARLKKIVLTESGIKIHCIIYHTIVENETKFNSMLTAEERDTFLTLIRKLREGLENLE